MVEYYRVRPDRGFDFCNEFCNGWVPAPWNYNYLLPYTIPDTLITMLGLPL